MSFFKLYNPPAQLQTIVQGIQVYHINWINEETPPPPFVTCLASTEQGLYFYLNDPIKVVPAVNVEIPAPPVVITGPKYETIGLLFGKDTLMIKISFHPTGLYRLLGIPMQPTVNTGLDATQFWGGSLQTLLEDLRKAPGYDAMVDVVTAFLLQQAETACRPEEPIDRVAIQMRDSQKDHSLEEWAGMACLSLRQFERNFTKRVGIPPKLFVRIVRFEGAMKIKNACPEKTWAEIAQECGYTDSSHILREFKEFAEFPPSQFYLQHTSGYSQLATG